MLQRLYSCFRSHFRMYRRTFSVLLDVIGQDLAGFGVGRPRYNPAQQVEIALWHLVNLEVHRKTSLVFNVAMDTAHRTTIRFCDAVIAHRNDFMFWPQGGEALEVMQEFQAISGIPRIKGVIDSSDIEVSDPVENAQAHHNRKNFMSIKLQGVVLPNRSFSDVYTGEPGAMHDARQFRRSPLGDELMDAQQRQQLLPNDSHLLADSAYQLQTFMLTPYRGNGLNAIEANYNVCLSSTRIVVEHTFGMLKNRFRCLQFLYRFNPNIPPKIVLTCCILHNLCVVQDDLYNFVRDNNLPHPNANQFAGVQHINAVQKRDMIALAL
ncbi:hypothetical protein B566_EDAN014260 [Ephemera danica]|nr:hypothetical protein B566_EDAN014260 [Ephemera danica]